MRYGKLCLFLFIVLLLYTGTIGHAETMYVTDRLYLSLRNAPDAGQPSLDLLPSDTKVEVLETEGNWAKVKLEDGRTGWVMKRFLVKDLPQSLIIEQLKEQLENRNITLEGLRQENASLKQEIENLKDQIIQQNERIEMMTKENTLERLTKTYGPVIVALLVGLNVGCLLIIVYLVRRLKRIRY